MHQQTEFAKVLIYTLLVKRQHSSIDGLYSISTNQLVEAAGAIPAAGHVDKLV